MNLAIRHIGFDLGKEPTDSFTRDQHPDLKADYVLANPPSTSRTGGRPGSRATAAGSTARRPRAMPTMAGCSTSSGTSSRRGRPASCWPMAPCRRTRAAKASSARR
jgi:hypothetical protein